MINTWKELSERHDLSRTDRESLESFIKHPKGRFFLPVAELLRKYGYDDDSLQILLDGLQRHPSYSPARVVLARSLFEKSIFTEAWEVLSQSPVRLNDNMAAQVLSLKLAVVLDFEEAAYRSKTEIEGRGFHSSEVRTLCEQLDVHGFAVARDLFVRQLIGDGYDLNSVFASYKKPVVNDSNEQEESDLSQIISGFYVAPLDQIFSPRPNNSSSNKNDQTMDALTLARVYRKQERYEKAQDIFKKLLHMAPKNELYRKELLEVQALRSQQEKREKEFDPELVHRLEQVEIIDRKIEILNTLIYRLDESDES